MLIYPVTDASFETASYVEMAEGYGLTRDTMQYFWDLYLADPAHATDPLASVLQADLARAAAPLVVTAEFDPLRSEGEAYAEKLSGRRRRGARLVPRPDPRLLQRWHDDGGRRQGGGGSGPLAGSGAGPAGGPGDLT